MLEAVKRALSLTTAFYDDELQDLINAALADLGLAGINSDSLVSDPLILQAVKTYCRAHFKSPDDYDKIVTGDLGSVGKEILCKLLLDQGYDISDVYMDCGMEIYKESNRQFKSIFLCIFLHNRAF